MSLILLINYLLPRNSQQNVSYLSVGHLFSYWVQIIRKVVSLAKKKNIRSELKQWVLARKKRKENLKSPPLKHWILKILQLIFFFYSSLLLMVSHYEFSLLFAFWNRGLLWSLLKRWHFEHTYCCRGSYTGSPLSSKAQSFLKNLSFFKNNIKKLKKRFLD